MGQLGVKSSRSLIGWTAKMAHSHVRGLSGVAGGISQGGYNGFSLWLGQLGYNMQRPTVSILKRRQWKLPGRRVTSTVFH